MAESSDRLVKLTIRLPEALIRAAKHQCLDAGVTLQDVVAYAVARQLKEGIPRALARRARHPKGE